jgi:hypothetical protein
MSNLHDALDASFAAAWRPAPGEKLVGTVTELGERDGPYGLYPIITVRQADGSEFAVHAFHGVLQNELARVAPKHGDQLGLKYSGPHPEKGYHRYVVRRAGDDSALSWAKYGAEDQSNIPTTDLPVPVEAGEAAEQARGDDAIPF